MAPNAISVAVASSSILQRLPPPFDIWLRSRGGGGRDRSRFPAWPLRCPPPVLLNPLFCHSRGRPPPPFWSLQKKRKRGDGPHSSDDKEQRLLTLSLSVCGDGDRKADRGGGGNFCSYLFRIGGEIWSETEKIVALIFHPPHPKKFLHSISREFCISPRGKKSRSQKVFFARLENSARFAGKKSFALSSLFRSTFPKPKVTKTKALTSL